MALVKDVNVPTGAYQKRKGNLFVWIGFDYFVHFFVHYFCKKYPYSSEVNIDNEQGERGKKKLKSIKLLENALSLH